MATIPLGLYLWSRIHQLGIGKIFGVPGDFNLTLLDYIYDVDGLDWVGNTNELNAGYAADGYARTKNGAGCLVTTHGVGELSALNAIAGSMTEQVKVVHVVGQTSRTMQEKRMMIHHSIGFEPDHQIFSKASEGFRVAAAFLDDEETAAGEIDRVLRECWVKSGPVYIFVPIDMVDIPVEAMRLERALELEPEVDEESVREAVEGILEKLYGSKRPAVFVDCLVQRHNAVQEARHLVEKLGILVYTTNMGKGIVDETHPNYLGLYNGEPSGPGVASSFESHDLVIVLGNLPSDTNSGGFSRKLDKIKAIYISAFDVEILDEKTYTVPIKPVLKSLISEVQVSQVPQYDRPELPAAPSDEDPNSKNISQNWLWHHTADTFLQPHDVLFGETGTAAFGLPDSTFPPSTHWITQTYYGSIGYATPAALGAELALLERRHSRGRTILCTGDGSLMLTVQEIGNMIHLGLCPVILIINNSGYTVERLIHGAHMSYNDIVPFRYEYMLPFFNMPAEEAKKNFHRCETRAELEEMLGLESVKNPKTVQVVEIVMDRLDVPWRLATHVAMRGEKVVRELREAGFKVRDPRTQAESSWQ